MGNLEMLNIPKIKVLGVGGGGVNVIYRNMKQKCELVEFVAVNTDLKSLLNKKCDMQVQIGEKLTKGQGAGTKSEIGKLACEESRNLIKKVIEDADLLILTAGMGGGTGTGAVPVIAEIAKELGILTVGIVTVPFAFEGAKRMETARQGVENLKKHVDSLIVIQNDKLIYTLPKGTKFLDAFKTCDDVLMQAINSIINVVVSGGEINIDFNDVQTVLRDSGFVYMNVGKGDGENKCINALKDAIINPLIETEIAGITDAILQITSKSDELGLTDVENIATEFKNIVGENVNIIFGLSYDETKNNEVEVTIIGSKMK